MVQFVPIDADAEWTPDAYAEVTDDSDVVLEDGVRDFVDPFPDTAEE